MIHLHLDPREGWLAKDGRGWYTAGSGRGRAHPWPPPTTLLGALRTGWGRSQEGKTAWSAQEWRDGTAGIRLNATVTLRRPLGCPPKAEFRVWPAPHDALYLAADPQRGRAGDRIECLHPIAGKAPFLSTHDDASLDTLWWPSTPTRSKPLGRPTWWSEAMFVRWLSEGKCDDVSYRAAPPVRLDTHVGMSNATQTADPSFLYSHEIQEPIERGADGLAWTWSLAAQVTTPNDRPIPGPIGLGADRRILHVDPQPTPALFAPPTFSAPASFTGLRVVAVTPAEFAHGWLPDGFVLTDGLVRGAFNGRRVVLRSAFVGRPLHVSGWDMAANQPKPTRRLCPAGSVWFLESDDGAPFTAADLTAGWLQSWTDNPEGLGRYVVGAWNPTSPRS